jgi:hypothetical protein
MLCIVTLQRSWLVEVVMLATAVVVVVRWILAR